MAINIRSISVGGIYIQSGNGIPNHLSPKGTIFIDIDSANEFISNGNGSWKSSYLLTQNQYDAITGATSPSSTNVFATINDVISFSGSGSYIPLSGTNGTDLVSGNTQYTTGLQSVISAINGDDGSYVIANGQISQLLQYNTNTNTQAGLTLIGNQFSLAGVDTTSGIFASLSNDSNGAIQFMSNNPSGGGIIGNQDFSISYTPLSYIQKAYADNTYAPLSSSTIPTLAQILLSGNITGTNNIVVSAGYNIQSDTSANYIGIDNNGTNKLKIFSEDDVIILSDNTDVILQGGFIKVNAANYGSLDGNTDYSPNYTSNSFIQKSYADINYSANTYTSGFTFNNSTYDLAIKRNDGVNLIVNLGLLANDVNVTGGTYNSATGIVTFRNNSGGTFNVSGFTTGMTDSYTTSANLVGKQINFNNNIYGPSFYSVDLTPALSGFSTGSTIITGFTYNNNNSFFLTNNTGGTLTAKINIMSGLTITGLLSANTVTVNGGPLSLGSSTLYPAIQFISGGTPTTKSNGMIWYDPTFDGVTIYNDNTVADTMTWTNGTVKGTTAIVSSQFIIGTATNHDLVLLTNNASYGLVISKTNGYATFNGGTSNSNTAQVSINSGALTRSFVVRDNSDTNDLFLVDKSGLTKTITLSATTYLGLPIDVRITGGTYSAGTAVFTNNTGGTFSVSGFTTGSSGTTTSLQSTQVAYGSTANTITSSSGLTYDNTYLTLGTVNTDNILRVLGTSTGTTFDAFIGAKRYPRFTLTDTSAGGASFSFWNLGNQFRMGTNSGNFNTSSFIVYAGDAADTLFNGNLQIGPYAAGVLTTPRNFNMTGGRPNSNITPGSFTVQGFGAFVTSNNVNGGNLLLNSGLATGSGTSSIQFATAGGGISGTTDSNPSVKMLIDGLGNVNIGTGASNTSNFGLVRIGQGASKIDLGQAFSGGAGIWANQTTNSTNNYSLAFDGSNTYYNTPNSGAHYFYINGTGPYHTLSQTQLLSTPLGSNSGLRNNFTFVKPANTNQTASSAVSGWIVSGGSKQWLGGNIITQIENYWDPTTYSFTTASTITTAIGNDFYAPLTGTNATFGTAYAIRSNGGILINDGTISGGMQLRALVGSTSLGAIYSNQTIPTVSNASLYASSTSTNINVDGTSGTNTVSLSIGNNPYYTITGGAHAFQVIPRTAGSLSTYTFLKPANTNQTASTQINGWVVSGGSRNWLGGNITTQIENNWGATTYSFTTASTITKSIGNYFRAPLTGTNATFLSNFAIATDGGIEINSLGTPHLTLRPFTGVTGINNGDVYFDNTSFYGRVNGINLDLAYSLTGGTLSGSNLTLFSNNNNPNIIISGFSGGSGNFVPYSGAAFDVNLNTKNLSGGSLTIAPTGTQNGLIIDGQTNVAAGSTLFRITNSNGNSAFRMDNGDLKGRFYGNGGIDYPSVVFASTSHGIGGSGTQMGIIVNNLARVIVGSATTNITTSVLIGHRLTTPTAFLHITGSTTSSAALRIEGGNGVISPNDGDIWNDNTGLYFKNSASTYNILTDTYITGGTYSAGTIIFTNNTGGSFNVSGITSSGSSNTLKTKSGLVINTSFTGTLLTYNVTFITPFSDALYSPSIVGDDSRSWSVSSRTSSGFIINSNSSTPLSGNVYWTAIKHGEN